MAYHQNVVAMMPLNFEIVRLASNGIFVQRYTDHPFTLEVQHIAELLSPNIPK
jgi:hypothetical protein